MRSTKKNIAQILHYIVKSIEFCAAEIILAILFGATIWIAKIENVIGLCAWVFCVTMYRTIIHITSLWATLDIIKERVVGFIEGLFIQYILTPIRIALMWINKNK